jgi:aspartyl-tRNA(Asn)/glutamyl-tRNA(Gln) amidotransferase subunit C
MTRVTPEIVEHVASLARLSLRADERDALARDLDQILRYATSVQTLDTSGASPMSLAQVAGSLRPDTPTPGLTHDAALASAPDSADGLFRVPRVIAT